eukprot:Pgem_evm1s4903
MNSHSLFELLSMLALSILTTTTMATVSGNIKANTNNTNATIPITTSHNMVQQKQHQNSRTQPIQRPEEHKH